LNLQLTEFGFTYYINYGRDINDYLGHGW